MAEDFPAKPPRKPAARKAAPAKGPVSKATGTAKPAKPLKKAATRNAATTRPAAARTKAAGTASGEKAGRNWRNQAENLKASAGRTARSAAETGKAKTGEALHGLSKLINDTAGTVDEKMGPQYGDYARYAAQAVAGAAKSWDSRELDELTSEARDFVRKSPAVAIGAAAVLGYVLMRLAKGSEPEA